MVVPHLQLTFELLQLRSSGGQCSSCECLANSLLAIVVLRGHYSRQGELQVARKLEGVAVLGGAGLLWKVKKRVVVHVSGL